MPHSSGYTSYVPDMVRNHPDNQPTTSTRKRISDMSTDEIRERANKDAVTYWRQQLEQSQHDPQIRYEYEQSCHRANQKPDAETDRLYSIPIEQLKAELEKNGRTVEDQNLDTYRVEQGKIWMASQPRYVPSMPAANLIYERMNALGLKGTVHEHQYVWEALVAEGKIDAPAAPVVLYSREELQNMDAATMKKALHEMGFPTTE